jgi:hypothetical protein
MTATPSPQRQAWQALIEQPLRFVNPSHLRQGWPQAMTEQQYASIAAAPRFVERRVDRLLENFNLQPLAQMPSPDEQDLPVLVLTPEAFEQLPRRCGAFWHAATLSREIRGDVVSTLRDLLGSDVFSLAVAQRSLAGAADLLRRPAELIQAIDQDGTGLVAAWFDHQPAPLRQWLNLRFNVPSTQGAAFEVDQVLHVVRCAAATFNQPARESVR